MNKWMARLAIALALGGIAYYGLVLHSPAPSSAYALDIARIRALAGALPGPGPAAVRYEEVLALRFAEAMVMAGEPWRETPMPVYSYQLVYPDRTIVIDTALSKADGIVIMNNNPDIGDMLGVGDSTELPNRAPIEEAMATLSRFFVPPAQRNVA